MNQISLQSQTTKSQDPNIHANNLQQQEAYQRNISMQIASFIKNNQVQDLKAFLKQNQIHNSILTTNLATFVESNHQNPEILQLLLSNNADVNYVIHTPHYQGITILMYCIKINNLSLFNLIMNYHPDILIKDSHQWNAVVYAILNNEENNHFLLLKLLNPETISTIAFIDNTSHNLLTLATAIKKKKFVDILLKTDIDINYQTTPFYDSALHISVKTDNVEIAELLLKNKNLNKKLENSEMKTAFELAKERKGKVYYQLFIKQYQKEPKKKKVNSLYIPIDLKNETLTSMIEVGESPKLCVNINNSLEKLNAQLIKNDELMKEKNNMIKRLEMALIEKDNKILEITNGIASKESELIKFKTSTAQQKTHLAELMNQTSELNKYLQNQSNPVYQFNLLSSKYSNIVYNDSYIIKWLQNDLIDYQAYIKEIITHKRPVIDDLINSIQLNVNEINPDYKVKLYGSYATGLCLPWSDLDVVLVNTTSPIDDFILSKLYSVVANESWVKTHLYIQSTNIPIIKLVSNDQYNFQIDISVQSEKHMGLKCVDLVKSYLSFYPVLEPIVLALKTLLNNGSLNNPYKGGLSSYGLILMVVSYIQSENENQNSLNDTSDILGKTFLYLLRHYGICFDFDKYVILAYPVGNANNANEKDTNFPFGSNQHELIIVDPLNKQNNVAKSTFQFMSIKMAFMIAYMVAREDCECGCHYNVLQNKHFASEHCILKRIFNSVKRFSEAKPL